MTGIRTSMLFALVLALVAGVASAQSLAELAKKEKKRRETNQGESKTVITDRELSSGYGTLSAPPTLSGDTSAAAGESATDEEPAGDEAAAEDETKTPEYWRGRVAAANEKIARLEGELRAEDSGEGQPQGVDPMGVNNLQRRQKMEQDIAAARAELDAIREEARRAGVPPGWVR